MTLEEQIAKNDDEFYRMLYEAGCLEAFAQHMTNRAELIARTIPGCQSDRQAAVFAGMLAICYKLTDDALAAQSESEMKAKVEEAERIRQELVGK